MKKARLYYFPYAGASSVTYKTWGKNFDTNIEFKVMDYPGHGKRSEEPFCASAFAASKDLYQSIVKDYKKGESYYFAGHCLGALICFEVCHMLAEKQDIALPERLFLSGHGAPDKIIMEGLHKMSDEELIAYQKSVGGIPEELLKEDFIDYVKEIVLPPIRYDSKAYEEYTVKEGRDTLKVPLTVINGLNDWKSPQEEVKRWDSFSTGTIKYVNYNTNHYFINTMTQEYLNEINLTIQADLLELQ